MNDQRPNMLQGWFKRLIQFSLMRDSWISARQLVPNFFTLLSICCAMLSIRWAVEREFEWSMAAIIASALLDGVDGRMARLFNAQSKFGEEFDSLADFVAFGVAPGILLFNWGLVLHEGFGWAAITALALCCGVRLARFNAWIGREQNDWEKDYMMGVPAPAGAMLSLLPLYLDGLKAFGQPHLVGLTTVSWASWAVVGYTVMVAFLMVSTIPTFAGKKTLDKLVRYHPIAAVALLGVIVFLLIVYPYATLAAGSIVYLILMPLGVRKFLKLMKLDDEDEDEFGGPQPTKAAD